jgi:UPF0755 protein
MSRNTGGIQFRVILALSILLGAIGFVLAGVRIWTFAYQPMTKDPNLPVVEKIIEVSKSARPQKISELLYREGLISNPRLFYWWGRIRGEWPKLKAGEYQIRSNQTPDQIFSVLKSGVSVARLLTIPEGKNMYEVAKLMESSGFGHEEEILRLFKDSEFISSLGFQPPFPKTLEGYLFPETYQFSRDESLIKMISTMVRQFHLVWQPEWDERLVELKMTRHEIVTLASVIEKETGAPFERPLISGVFHNRLRKRMRLQSDPTTIYGIWERYTGNLRRSDLLEPTPYNTYVIFGLPAGPISNPGKEALRAALYPAETDALYFVSKNDGTHIFSATLKDHNQAVSDYQKNPKAREGKSWRDLKKN